MAVSFPETLSAQKEVVRNFELFAAETEQLASVYKRKLENLNQLKESILQKAFTGELTMQPGKALQEAAE